MLRALLRASALPLLALLAATPLLPAPPGTAQDGADDRDKEFFRREMVLFEAFERSATRGSEVRLEFRVQWGYRTPILVVVYPDGRSTYTFATSLGGGGRYEVLFPLDRLGGTHRVSLVVDSDRGDSIAAQFLVKALDTDGKEIDRDLDLPPADAAYPALDPGEHPLRLERVLFHRMNGLRAKNGLPPLPWHEGVARAAREHMPDVAVHYEKSFDPRKGWGELPHMVPGAGRDGGIGPSIAERVRVDLRWPLVTPKLPPADPQKGVGAENYISEAILAPDTSLDRRFEQVMLRKSDMRAPMLNDWTTHAAGAAVWRVKAPGKEREGTGDTPGGAPRTPGETRTVAGRDTRHPTNQVIATLVFIQVNDPRAALTWEKEKREDFARASRASKPEEKAAAWRALGQGGYFDAIPSLRKACGDRRPEVAAGALDGLWLAAPDAAREVADRHRARLFRAFEDGNFSRAADDVAVLSRILYDAASRRDGTEARDRIRKKGRELLDAVDLLLASGRLPEAKEGFEAVARNFDGFPEGEEAKLALRELLASPLWREGGGR